MFAAILQSAESLLIVPTELAFWEGDLRPALRANKTLGCGRALNVHLSRCRSSKRNLGLQNRCFCPWGWSHELRQLKLIGGTMLPLELFTPLLNCVPCP